MALSCHIGRRWRVALLGLLLVLAGCAGSTTPPGPNIIYGSLLADEGVSGSYTILLWNDGLMITLVGDGNTGSESGGSGSTGDPVWRGQGSIRGRSGQDVRWQVETSDGQRATLVLNGQVYDLAQGTLFLIRTAGASPTITQRQSLQSGPCIDHATCQSLLQRDPAVWQFIQETPPE